MSLEKANMSTIGMILNIEGKKTMNGENVKKEDSGTNENSHLIPASWSG